MKILVVSDTHGYTENLDKVLEREKNIEMMIHCGDVEGDERYIRERTGGYPCCIVKGNNDHFSDLPKGLVFDIFNYKIMVTHGHNYGVSMSTDGLREEARLRGVQIVLFGHTHRPFVEEKNGIVLMNPGSLTYPRQSGRVPSYLILNITKDGKFQYEQKVL